MATDGSPWNCASKCGTESAQHLDRGEGIAPANRHDDDAPQHRSGIMHLPARHSGRTPADRTLGQATAVRQLPHRHSAAATRHPLAVRDIKPPRSLAALHPPSPLPYADRAE